MEAKPPDDLIPPEFRRSKRRKDTRKKDQSVPPPIRAIPLPKDAIGDVGTPVQAIESEYIAGGGVRDRKMSDLRHLLTERKRRSQEALKLYEPMAVQALFHESRIKTRVVRGCVAGETPIYDPVAGVERRVDEIDADFHVVAMREDGELVAAFAEKPFLKGVDDLYRVSLDGGESFIATLEHRVLATDGWVSVGEISERIGRGEACHLVSASADGLLASREDGRRSRETPEDSLAGCQSGRRLCDGRPPVEASRGQEFRQQQGDARERSRRPSHKGAQACTPGCSQTCRTSARPSNPCAQGQTSGRDGASNSRSGEAPCSSPRDVGQGGRRSPGPSSPRDTTPSSARLAIRGAVGLLTQYLALSGSGSRRPESSPSDRPLVAESARSPLAEPLHPHQSSVVSVDFVRRDRFYDLTVPVWHNYHCSSVIHHNSNRGGKEQPVSEPVLTPLGVRQMGELKVGDEVIAGDGSGAFVTAVYPQGVKPVYRVTLADGSWTRCGAEHLWYAKTDEWGVIAFKDLYKWMVRTKTKPLIPKLFGEPQPVKSIHMDGDEESVCISVDHPSHTYVTRDDIITHNTLPSAVEVARAVLNCDPYGKYPKVGIVYVIGYDYSHHGQTIYPKLFLSQPESAAGPFKVIKDLKTKLLRAFRPWEPEDHERRFEAEEAGPLIPPRYVQEISWESKKENIPSMIRLVTGWEMWFFSGDGQPPRGAAIDLGWIDEEIKRPDWHSELVSRTADRNGLIIWSASPQTGTVQLFELHNQAKREAGDADRVVEEYHVKLADNKHLSAKSKHEIIASNQDELNRITRVEGDFIQSTKKVFTEYSVNLHSVQIRVIPGTWSRYAFIDPGHQICAVLFMAVPTPAEQDDYGEMLLYDELYLPKCDAKKFAQNFHGKVAGHVFEDWIIDAHGARFTEAGSGKSVLDQYLDELRALQCANRRNHCGFTWGSDDVKSRIEAARGYLRVGPRGRPRFRVAAEVPDYGQPIPVAQNFQWEIDRYAHKTVNGLVTDEPETRGRVHAMWCFAAACAYRPQWVDPVPFGNSDGGPAYRAFMAKKKGEGGRLGLMFGNPGRTE